MDESKIVIPKNIEEYIEWLYDRHKIKITSRYQNYYESVTNKIINDFSNSELWGSIIKKYNIFNQEYYLKNGYYLFASETIPVLKAKPYKSFLLKTFRKNILENNNYPNPPEKGWYLPENWFSLINDIVRCLFTVKYLDGVNFLGERIITVAKEFSVKYQIDYEAKEEGYYAAHTYIFYSCGIPKEDWDTKNVEISIELQITTQLQEVIRSLLHKYYEETRKRVEKPSVKWQWDYKSDEFATNYLGHILHYIEGMIIEVREKQREL